MPLRSRRFTSRFLFPFAVLATLTGCAETLTPAQSRAWDAFKDCQKVATTARLTQLTPEGRLGFESREGDYQAMIKCLSERHGYKFQ